MTRQKEYLNEKNYRKGSAALTILGIVVMLAAAALAGFGITRLLAAKNMVIPAMTSSGWFEARQQQSSMYFTGGACCMFGAFIFFLGISIVASAHRRSILAWKMQQVMPLAGEAAEKIQPVAAELGRKTMDTMAPAFGHLAEEVSKGINSGRSSSGETFSGPKKYCRHCGKPIEDDSAFCAYCGKEL